MSDRILAFRRVVEPKAATSLVGTQVDTDLEPSFRGPSRGERVILVDEADGAVIGAVTRLPEPLRPRLRQVVLGLRYGEGVARHAAGMTRKGATFGYAPPKVIARQEACRITMTARDNPEAARVLDATAVALTREFDSLFPERAEHDRAVVDEILPDWRMGDESLWTSGVINQANVLPYHRDGNNLDTWSAMPVLRKGMAGGLLHVPEYDLVYPCEDGTVTWFYGRGLVHGVTPMMRRHADAYRYSIVFYALRGMEDCATYAEETVRAAVRRTERERAEAAKIRASQGLADESEPLPVEVS